MPILLSSYTPPWPYHRHLSTIYYGRIKSYAPPKYRRETLTYPDNDFIDLDWIDNNRSKLLVIVHGLEGCSTSPAVIRLANYFSALHFDILAINLRGCSGRPNLKLESYNSGSSEQLKYILDIINARGQYPEIFLTGISAGGNISLKYLGEIEDKFPSSLKAAVAISVPCDLAGSSKQLAKFENKIYLWDFLRSLKNKVRQKCHLLPSSLNINRIMESRTFEEFDENFTAPVSGFSGAAEYYRKSSSLAVLEKIRLPTLLLTAMDDPFLNPSCYPCEIAKEQPSLYLEVSRKGGHVAFPNYRDWLARRTEMFFEGKDIEKVLSARF